MINTNISLKILNKQNNVLSFHFIILSFHFIYISKNVILKISILKTLENKSISPFLIYTYCNSVQHLLLTLKSNISRVPLALERMTQLILNITSGTNLIEHLRQNHLPTQPFSFTSTDSIFHFHLFIFS